MSDLERLAKIEARHNSVTSEDRIGPKRHAQYVLLHEDMPWLLARVRELEAQAAVDAKLREVVLEWAQAKTELDAHLESGPLDMDVVGDLMMTHRLSRERMWEVLTPMLAAREEG